MREKNMTFCREELEKLSTRDLEALLCTELDRDTPERKTVLLVLSILEERDPTDSANRPEGAEEAWKRMLERQSSIEPAASSTIHKPLKLKKWAGIMGTIAAVLVLVLLIPQAVCAENIFQIIGRWTKDLFEFSDSSSTPDTTHNQYRFETENKELQQFYDMVTAHGITDPVVPTWIPEEYTLEELQAFPDGTKIYARFSAGDRYIQITVEKYYSDSAYKYPKDDDLVNSLELNNQKYHIMPNDDTWKALWKTENVECSIITNDTEETLTTIIKSIHGRLDI